MPTILIVEDNEMNMKLFSDLLKISEYHVIPCFNPYKTLQLIKNKKPDLVIMDICLPGISGLEIARRIRRIYPKDVCQIIAITGYDEIPLNKLSLFSAVLSKPINIPLFLKTVSKFTQKKLSPNSRESFL